MKPKDATKERACSVDSVTCYGYGDNDGTAGLTVWCLACDSELFDGDDLTASVAFALVAQHLKTSVRIGEDGTVHQLEEVDLPDEVMGADEWIYCLHCGVELQQAGPTPDPPVQHEPTCTAGSPLYRDKTEP